ncbi:MAG TPA: hypothetical protein VMT03_21925 [Polyangia bacterium]|nr:hypothetical protein [Polyangia bacterium]
MKPRLPIALALLTGAAACQKATPLAVAANLPCDPLAPEPIGLGAIVGVGQDGAGTLYVDAANGIFVSQSGQLIRQHVIGTGQSGAQQFIYSFEPPSPDAGAPAVNLLVQTDGTKAIAMALGPSDSKDFLGQADAGVSLLSVVPDSTVSALPIVNTPNVISYIADVDNGDVLMTTVPMNQDPAAPNGGRSVFYGPPGDVAQRTVVSFQQSLSGTGTLVFMVDGVAYGLNFASVATPGGSPLGTFTLTSLAPQGGTPMSVTLRSPTPTSTPSELSFTCSP